MSRRDALALVAAGILLPSSKSSPAAAMPDASSNRHAGDPLHYSSLAEIAGLIEAGKVLPTDLTRQMLKRIAAVDPVLQSYVTVTGDHAMESARRADDEIRSGKYRGPLHGVPIGVKDLCHMRNVRTMAGTKVLSNSIPDFDSAVVARLEAAGAVILGKLALCEGAFGPYHPGLQVPVNPWNPARWSGVSSSGSGVATAAGLCFASVGTDTGGSIRYPSAANGCVGLKPTYGRISRHGVFGLAESLDHVGPMTRTVEDAAIMFEVMAGFDPNDPASLSAPVPKIRSELDRGAVGLRIGFDRSYATVNVDPDVARAVQGVLATLARLGATIVEIEMPDVSGISAAWFELCAFEATRANEATWPSRASEYGAGFREVLEYGSKVSEASLASAGGLREQFSERLEVVLSTVDCIVCPSMANAASIKSADPYIPETDEEWSRLVVNDIHTKPFNFSGSPTLSVPCGLSSEGLPLSVQFVGRRLSEEVLCRAGHAFERATEWHSKHPAV